jgi:small-conductance mechanosensitive channel
MKKLSGFMALWLALAALVIVALLGASKGASAAEPVASAAASAAEPTTPLAASAAQPAPLAATAASAVKPTTPRAANAKPAPAVAQSVAEPAPPVVESSTEPATSVDASEHSAAVVAAPVSLLNRTIVVFRSSYLGVPPRERAERTEQRLTQVLSNVGAGKIIVASTGGANAILIDGALGVFITPGDVEAIDGQTLDETTRVTVAAIARAIADSREGRDRERIARAIVASGIATFALLVLCFFVLRARSWFERRVMQVLRGGTTRLPGPRWRMLFADRLLWLGHWLAQTAAGLLLLLAIYRWLSFVLNQFPYTRPWGEELDGFLLGAAAQIGGGIVRALPDLLVALVIFLLARGVIAIVRPFFDNIEQRQSETGWLDADTAKPTRRIFSLAVWLFATVMAYPYLPGSSSEAFKGMSVLIGLMVTLGGSSLFGQAASGLILLYSRTLRIGEFVRVGTDEGTVTELGVFTTRIATGRGEHVTLPNALVLSSVTRNYSRPAGEGGFMLRSKVTIGYDTPWRQVDALLLEAARTTAGVSSERPPRVYQTALSDFYVEYELVCRASQRTPDDRADVLATLNANIIDTFNRYGVQIMSPHYLGDPAARKTVPVAAWRPAPAPADGSENDQNGS